MSNPVIGKDCVLAYDLDATRFDTPTWTALSDAVDVSMPGITKTVVDLPSRGSQGWNVKGGGLKSVDLQFGLLWHGSGTVGFDDLMDSFENDTPLVFGVYDGPTDGSADRDVEGFKFVGIVTEMAMTEELEDARRFDVKVELARYVDSGDLKLPEWDSIASTP